MELDTLIINEPEFKEWETSTRESRPHELRGTDEGGEQRIGSPSKDPLDVLMTFSGDTPVLTVEEIGVIAKGDRIEDALRRLFEAARETCFVRR